MAKPQLDPFSSPSSSSCSCKTTTNHKNNMKKKREIGNHFSESEINAAEQLIQLSGDSDDVDTNSAIISDGDTTTHHHQYHLITTIASSSTNSSHDGDDHGDQITLCGSGPIRRKIKRFKSLSDIYSLTKPLSMVNNNYRR